MAYQSFLVVLVIRCWCCLNKTVAVALAVYTTLGYFSSNYASWSFQYK